MVSFSVGCGPMFGKKHVPYDWSPFPFVMLPATSMDLRVSQAQSLSNSTTTNITHIMFEQILLRVDLSGKQVTLWQPMNLFEKRKAASEFRA